MDWAVGTQGESNLADEIFITRVFGEIFAYDSPRRGTVRDSPECKISWGVYERVLGP